MTAKEKVLDLPPLELMPMPEVPRKEFDNPPLVLAVCEIKFTNVLSVANAGFVAPFQQAIQDRYPVTDSGHALELTIALGAQAAVRQETSGPRWQFSDAEDTWTVVLAQDGLAIETRAYLRFDDFLERLRHVLGALVEYVRPTLGTRLGLRYVNEIPVDPLHSHEVIRPELLGPLSVPEFTMHARQLQSIQQISLRYDDHQGVNLNHGLFPSGTMVRPRAGEERADRPFYLLDFDVFRAPPRPPGLVIDPDRICTYVAAYHQVIHRLFRWAVTDAYVATLRERSHASA